MYFLNSHLLDYVSVLSVAPGDEDALRCKIVALIKDDKIDNALSAIQSSKTADFSFFKVDGILGITLAVLNMDELSILGGHYSLDCVFEELGSFFAHF